MTLTVSEIGIYPVKSLSGVYPREAELVETGFRHDRQWMVVDENGTFLTQRQHPRMARIRAALTPEGLHLAFPEGDSMIVPIVESGDSFPVKVWGDTCAAIDQGREVAERLSTYLGRASRLVRMAPAFRRRLGSKYRRSPEMSVGFADSSPLLLIGQSSLEDLNSRLEIPVEMNRFRTNLVVAGAEPFEEDRWSRIRIGGTTFHLASACIRCEIVNVDQRTGQKGIEPLEMLEQFRVTPKGPRFGMKMVHEGLGTIRVGDEVEVLE